MLVNDGPLTGSYGAKQECRPDYERLITEAKLQLSKNTCLQDALFDYLGNRTVSGKLAEMVGELVSEERVLTTRIDQLIKQQESDGK